MQAPKDVSVRDVLIHTAQSRFYDDVLYKSTFYLLTYRLSYPPIFNNFAGEGMLYVLGGVPPK